MIVDGAEENRELISLFSDWRGDRWDPTTLEARVNALESGAPPDPAATTLSDLLVAGLGNFRSDCRAVVLDPFSVVPPESDFPAFEEELPELL